MAGGLMVVGIAVIGVVTASVAAWLLKQGQQPAQACEQSKIRALREEIQALCEQVAQLAARDQTPIQRVFLEEEVDDHVA